jgi:DNA helicase-2/ATP-dependent DNA helicase PcrA
MEEGLFPTSRSLVEPEEMEEERRLCYVGMTRARKKLVLTSARQRRLYGSLQYNAPSRFIDDIPIELMAKKELNNAESAVPAEVVRADDRSAEGPFLKRRFLNRPVVHPLWGRGVVLSVEGAEKDLRLTIRFDSVGTKKMANAHANLRFE